METKAEEEWEEGEREEWTSLDVKIHYKALLIKACGDDS